MEAKEAIKSLEKSPEFKKWRKKDKESCLSNAFLILEEPDKWSIGYYSKKKNRITTFEIGKQITIKPYEKIFSTGEEVKELKLDDVKTGLDNAVGICNTFRKKNYPSENSIKTIIVLQNLSIGQVYNITYLTSAFSTLNMKIDTSSGKILKHTLVPLFRFDKGSN